MRRPDLTPVFAAASAHAFEGSVAQVPAPTSQYFVSKPVTTLPFAS
jgi:hypothetical protein